MTLNNSNIQQLVLLVGLLFCFSCSNEVEKPEQKVESKNQEKKLFPFYKRIELKPGFNFEILSWGIGPDSIGAYQILMSDSVKNNYKSISVERQGIITDAWNMDLDNDGNAEIYIEINKNKKPTDLNVFEYVNGGFNRINFPSLNTTQKKIYKGNDKFFIKNGNLYRTFNVIDETDSAKTTLKTLEYKLGGNSFSSAEIKPE
jgi:hypothetical protein